MLVIFTISGFFFYQNNQIAEIRDKLDEGETASRLKKFEEQDILRVYLVKSEGTPQKIIQKISTNGFVDTITMMVTIDFDTERIESVEILKHTETEDYGGYVIEDWFLNRFKGNEASQTLTLVKMFKKKTNEIVTITGASKTSAAVVNGVNLSLQNFLRIKGGLN